MWNPVKSSSQHSYNERLFSSGLRKQLHLARFLWFQEALKRWPSSYKSVIELGCFDGKLIDFLPAPPDHYVGYDANWEGGLDLGKVRWQTHSDYRFILCLRPEQIVTPQQPFDLAVCMETLEHIPPGLVDPYLARLAEVTRGRLFITIPNEKGLVFLSKWTLKRLLSDDYMPYTLQELVAATRGQMHRVQRKEHKGFDYQALVEQVATHFRVLEVSGFPFARILPRDLCFGIGVVAESLAPRGQCDAG